MKQTILNAVAVDQDVEAHLDRVFERISILYGDDLPAFFKAVQGSAEEVQDVKGQCQLDLAALGLDSTKD